MSDSLLDLDISIDNVSHERKRIPMPKGVTAPRPVTTTLRISILNFSCEKPRSGSSKTRLVSRPLRPVALLSLASFPFPFKKFRLKI